ncbi:rhodanese-like domain-containing protein [Candidatus Daviesbacteria bacterium]|nr:rhodanese-like domain-containing protein [Candidatus Daviesbacteria bacterium]
MSKHLLKTVILSAIVGAIIGGSVSYTILFSKKEVKKTADQLIYDFYATENAVYVSPHSLRRMMDKGDNSYTLVDLRSTQEYEKEHIIGAVNIPAYKDPDTSAYEEKERIINQFRQLPKDREIIVYCYSMPCMTGRKIGLALAENGIFVKHLGIGWNEWRYFWTLWNHEHEWNLTKPQDYIFPGKEPGTPKTKELPSPCGEGQFSC